VRIVNLLEGDSVAALAVLTYEDLNREIDGGSHDDQGVDSTVAARDGNGLQDELPDELHDDILDEDGFEDDGLEDDSLEDDGDDSEAALAIAGEDEQ
jgi:hypothetical protein